MANSSLPVLDKTAKLWNLQGALIADLNQHTDYVYSASFSPDGKFILTSSRDKTAKLWNLQGALIADLNQHTAYVSSASFSPDGKFILTSSRDKTAKLWPSPQNILAWLESPNCPLPTLSRQTLLQFEMWDESEFIETYTQVPLDSMSLPFLRQRLRNIKALAYHIKSQRPRKILSGYRIRGEQSLLGRIAQESYEEFPLATQIDRLRRIDEIREEIESETIRKRIKPYRLQREKNLVRNFIHQPVEGLNLNQFELHLNQLESIVQLSQLDSSRSLLKAHRLLIEQSLVQKFTKFTPDKVDPEALYTYLRSLEQLQRILHADSLKRAIDLTRLAQIKGFLLNLPPSSEELSYQMQRSYLERLPYFLHQLSEDALQEKAYNYAISLMEPFLDKPPSPFQEPDSFFMEISNFVSTCCCLIVLFLL